MFPEMRLHRAAMLVLLVACSRSDAPQTETAAARVPAPASPVVTTSSDTAGKAAAAGDCPATGRWALCSVEKRLRRAGFVVTKLESEEPVRPGFSVKPDVYKLGRGRLEVFLYEDAAAMEKDIADLDTLSVSPRGTPPAWPSQAALVRNGNVAAVYMGQDPRQAERLILAITAGAPSGG